MKKEKFAPLKRDLTGATIIGFAAATLSLIVLANLDVPLPYWAPFIIFPTMTIAGIFVARWLSRWISIMYKFVKFAETGGLNWLVDFGVLNLLIMFTGLSTGIAYAVFKGVSFLVATTNSYAWNKWWVFEARTKSVGSEAGKFVFSTLLGLVVNVGIASLIVIFGPKFVELDPKIWANIAAGIGSLSAMAWNFIMYKFWVFK